MRDELGGKVMTEFVALRPKTYSSLMHDGNSDRKAKGTKICVIKRILKILKSQQRFESKAHNVYVAEVNKIVLSSNDDKILKTFDRITSYPYATNVGKVCKAELLERLNIK